MEQVFTITFITGLLAAMMRMATPIIFGTLGEILSERAGSSTWASRGSCSWEP